MTHQEVGPAATEDDGGPTDSLWTHSASLLPSSSGEAVAIGCHSWNPLFEDACHGHRHGPSQARGLS
jgi:hypothetical protein